MTGVVRKFGRVRGRVQGVGFRFFTQRIGNALGLTGWVRNDVDGSVEFNVQGQADSVAEFLARVQRGPTAGRVDDLTVHDVMTVAGETGFSVKYH